MDYVPQASFKFLRVDFHPELNQQSSQNQLRTANLGILSAYQNPLAHVMAQIFTHPANTGELGNISG